MVSPATLQRVQKAVESLNFVRNSAARSLAGGVGNTVGLVLVDLANSLFVDISRGAEQCLHAHAKSLLIADSDVDLSRQAGSRTVRRGARSRHDLLRWTPG